MPTFCIHWLTITSRRSMEEVKEMFSLGDPHGSKGWGVPEDRGGYGQPCRVVHECGLALYYGSAREDQPVVLVASGDVCEKIDLVRVLVCGDKVTRFDVAADVEVPDAAAVVLALRDDALSGGLDCPQRAVRYAVDHAIGGGHTTYLGSPSSHLMLRCYSRRGPVRFEFQIRPSREVGQFYARHLRETPCDEIWRGFARDFKWDHPVWLELMTGPSLTPPPVSETEVDLNKTIGAIRQQHGVILAMLQAAGFTLADFADQRLPSAMSFNRCLRLAEGLPEGSYEQASRYLESLRPRLVHRRARVRKSGSPPSGVGRK